MPHKKTHHIILNILKPFWKDLRVSGRTPWQNKCKLGNFSKTSLPPAPLIPPFLKGGYLGDFQVMTKDKHII